MVKEIMATSNNYIDKEDFLHLYPPTHEKIFTQENIYGGFLGAGLKPLNRDQVLTKITFQLYILILLLIEGSTLSAF